jgi:hypothetical protein
MPNQPKSGFRNLIVTLPRVLIRTAAWLGEHTTKFAHDRAWRLRLNLGRVRHLYRQSLGIEPPSSHYPPPELPDTDDPQKYALACLRLAAQCKSMAAEASDPNLKTHFLERAAMWEKRAEGPLPEPARE